MLISASHALTAHYNTLIINPLENTNILLDLYQQQSK